MADGDHMTFHLRYVGARFEGARLPLDVLSDLPAFRDLLVSYAKDHWRASNLDRKRLPKGFDRSISFDLVALEEGSAVPALEWNRDIAQATLPGFDDELEVLVGQSYDELVLLVDGAGNARFPQALSSEHIRALNKLGAGLRDQERIEFLGSTGSDGNVVYLDTYRRKALITHVRETYQARFESIGRLLGSHVEGYIDVETVEYGSIRVPVETDRVLDEFDGNINSDVQFSLQVELDNDDGFRGIVDVFDVELIDGELADNLMRCRQRLVDLRNTQAGWLNGEGEAIAGSAVDVAERFLAKRPLLVGAYRIYPTDGGGVLFEFEKSGWDLSVEIASDGAIEFYGIQIDGPEELEPVAFAQLDDAFLAEFDAKTGREIAGE